MVKILSLQRYYNLSDDQTEYNYWTVFLYAVFRAEYPTPKQSGILKNELAKAGLVEKIFTQLNRELSKEGVLVRHDNILYRLDCITKTKKGILRTTGTNIGSTLLVEDLNNDQTVEFVYAFNENPYDPFQYSGMTIRCFTMKGYTSVESVWG